MERRRTLNRLWILVLVGLFWACSKKEPEPALPSYLRIPTKLDGYQGSGLITITGGTLNLRAEGPEALNPTSQTYQGVLGDISGEDVSTYFTFGQPRPYKDRALVPSQYQDNGKLSIMRTITPGTYQMGIQGVAGPRGELADLTLNLTGPQLYINNSGTLTITGSTLISSQGNASLYRLVGTFQAVMYADGIGISATGRNPTLSGTFDLLLVAE